MLEILAGHCVKATFFLIGRNARAEPQMARQILAAGHTIGTHTVNHPPRPMAPERAMREINTGILNVGAALGDPRAVAPFFRCPGLHHTLYAEQYLRARSIAAWSIDVDSHDWKRITPDRVLDNVLTRLAAKGRGVILLHDVQPRTAQILPALLTELKQRGYRIVHVVPPALPAPPDLIAMAQSRLGKEADRTPAASPVAGKLNLRPTIGSRRGPVSVARLRHAAKPWRPIKPSAAAPSRHADYRW